MLVNIFIKGSWSNLFCLLIYNVCKLVYFVYRNFDCNSYVLEMNFYDFLRLFDYF